MAPAIVWAVWGLMLLSVLFCIVRYGRDIPRAEDWLLVPPLTGNAPSLAGWLWEQNDEHRLPVPRLAYLGLLTMAGGDFRSGMVFNTLAIAALAAVMIYAAGQVRGHVALADSLFPLALLHLGHWHNLLWGWQIQFVLSVVLAGCVLLTIVLRGAALTTGAALGVGLACALLAMSGANGLALVPPLALWLALAGLTREDRAGGSAASAVRRAAPASAALASAAMAVYFLGYERAPWNPASPGPGATLRTAGHFLALAFGPGATRLRVLAVALALAILLVTGALLLARVWRSEASERIRALGLLLFLGASAVLGLAVGWGRAGRFPSGELNSRYAILAALFVCCVYFAWGLYGPRRWRALACAALALFMLAALPFNTLRGLADRNWVEAGMRGVERDLKDGLPRVLIAERHQPFLLHWDLERLLAGLGMLREAGLGPFAALREDPVREISMPWPDEAGPSPGFRSVPLGAALRVYGVRVRVSGDPESAPQSVARVAWRAAKTGTSREEPARLIRARPGQYRGATVWINEVIDRLEVRLDGADASPGASVTVLVSSND